MSPDEIAVLIGCVVAILAVNLWFLGPRSAR
jgi:hypothetical protein